MQGNQQLKLLAEVWTGTPTQVVVNAHLLALLQGMVITTHEYRGHTFRSNRYKY